MSALANTLRAIAGKAAEHDACLVAFSGGKDSLVTLDLCAAAFRRVEIFTFHHVRGVPVLEEAVAAAVARWGVKSHWFHYLDAVYAKANGDFCFPVQALADVPEIDLAGYYDFIRQETGIPLIATGCRSKDFWQRAQMIRAGTLPGWHPIADWSKHDVLAHLANKRIPLPPNSHERTNGVSLATSSVLWLYDHCREGYEALRREFPFIEAIVWRRVWHGVS